MQLLNAAFNLEQFWKSLRQSEQSLLMLDFDGTLSPFVVDPNLARPYPGVKELLQNIQTHGQSRLIVISGREVDSLAHCLELEPVPELWGCHGWQRRLPGGRTLQRGLSHAAEAVLRQAERVAEAAGYALNLERKPVSLALHWRGMARDKVAHMQELFGSQWRQLSEESGLQLHGFDGGLELRCADVHKGTAVIQLACEVAETTPIAYLGDDLTDEDAFNAMAERGLKVLVRAEQRPTAADLWLQPPEELLWFLQQWAVNTRGAESEPA